MGREGSKSQKMGDVIYGQPRLDLVKWKKNIPHTTTNPASNMQIQTSSATTFLGFSLPIVCISGTQSKGLRARSSVILESAPKFNKILTALTPKLAAAICSAVPFSYSAQVVSTSVPQTKNKIKNKLFSFFRQIAFSIFWQIFLFFGV